MPNISQGNLVHKFRAYIQLKRSQNLDLYPEPYYSLFMEEILTPEGFCNGYSLLSLYKKKFGMEGEFLKAIERISDWPEDLESLKTDNLDSLFKEMLDNILFAQTPHLQQDLGQQDWHKIIELGGSKENIIEKRAMIPLVLTRKEVDTYLPECIPEGAIVKMASIIHSTGCIKKDNKIDYFDPNDRLINPPFDDANKFTEQVQIALALGKRTDPDNYINEIMLTQFDKAPKELAEESEARQKKYTEEKIALLEKIYEARLKAGIKDPINIVSSNGNTTLSLACEMGDLDTVEWCLSKKANIHLGSPLLRAARAGSDKIIKKLIEHGAALYDPEKRSCISLNTAALRGNETIIRSLLSYIKNDTSLSKEQRENIITTALYLYVKNNQKQFSLVNVFVDFGANLNPLLSPLIEAINNNDADMVRALLEFSESKLKKANVLNLDLTRALNVNRAQNQNPLLLAVKNKSFAISESLINVGADVNFKDLSMKMTILKQAIINNDDRMAKLLIDHGAKVTLEELSELKGKSKKLTEIILKSAIDQHVIKEDEISKVLSASKDSYKDWYEAWNSSVALVSTLTRFISKIEPTKVSVILKLTSFVMERNSEFLKFCSEMMRQNQNPENVRAIIMLKQDCINFASLLKENFEIFYGLEIRKDIESFINLINAKTQVTEQTQVMEPVRIEPKSLSSQISLASSIALYRNWSNTWDELINLKKNMQIRVFQNSPAKEIFNNFIILYQKSDEQISEIIEKITSKNSEDNQRLREEAVKKYRECCNELIEYLEKNQDKINEANIKSNIESFIKGVRNIELESQPLSLAISNKQPETVRQLIAAGADPFENNSFIKADANPEISQILHQAVFQKKPHPASVPVNVLTALVEYLVFKNIITQKHGQKIIATKNIDALDSKNYTALELASKEGNLLAVRDLIALGAKSLPYNMYHRSPFLIAAVNGHADIVEFLLDEWDPEKIALSDHRNRNALHLAAMKGKFDVVKLLLKHPNYKAFAQAKDLYERTPLHTALDNNEDAIIKLIVETITGESMQNASAAKKRAFELIDYKPLTGSIDHGSFLDILKSFLIRQGADPKVIIGANDDDEGLCNGIDLMYQMYLELGQEDKYYDIVNTIVDCQDNLSKLEADLPKSLQRKFKHEDLFQQYRNKEGFFAKYAQQYHNNPAKLATFFDKYKSKHALFNALYEKFKNNKEDNDVFSELFDVLPEDYTSFYENREDLLNQFINDVVRMQADTPVFAGLGLPESEGGQNDRPAQVAMLSSTLKLNPIFHMNNAVISLSQEQLAEWVTIFSQWNNGLVEISGANHSTSFRVKDKIIYFDPNYSYRVDPFELPDNPRSASKLAEHIIKFKGGWLEELQISGDNVTLNSSFDLYRFYPIQATPPEIETPKFRLSAPSQSANRFTPLHYAIFSNDVDLIIELIEKDPAILNAKDAHGMTAVEWIIKLQNQPLLQQLRKRKEGFNIPIAKYLDKETIRHAKSEFLQYLFKEKWIHFTDQGKDQRWLCQILFNKKELNDFTAKLIADSNLSDLIVKLDSSQRSLLMLTLSSDIDKANLLKLIVDRFGNAQQTQATTEVLEKLTQVAEQAKGTSTMGTHESIEGARRGLIFSNITDTLTTPPSAHLRPLLDVEPEKQTSLVFSNISLAPTVDNLTLYKKWNDAWNNATLLAETVYRLVDTIDFPDKDVIEGINAFLKLGGELDGKIKKMKEEMISSNAPDGDQSSREKYITKIRESCEKLVTYLEEHREKMNNSDINEKIKSFIESVRSIEPVVSHQTVLPLK